MLPPVKPPAVLSPRVPAVVLGLTTPVPSAVPTRLRTMSSRELKELFKAALEHSRPLLQAPSAGAPTAPTAHGTQLTDLQKLQFYGYFKQATKGDASDSAVPETIGSLEHAKLEAWKKCRNLTRRDAMRAFVYLMYQVEPAWDNRSTLEPVPEFTSSSP